MSEPTTGQVSAQAAGIYEQFFVPALFGQWPARTLDLAGVLPGERVLDVGCGTGIQARAALERVGPHGSVIGVDPNDGMLAVARRAAPGIELRTGVAEDLPVGDGDVDRVLSAFALMFFTDADRAVREMARVLRPGGTAVLLTWADVETSPGYAAMVALLRRTFGDEPADALLAPFSVGTEDALRGAMANGFADVEVVRLEGEARFASIADWVRTDVAGWTLATMIDEAGEAQLRAAAERDLTDFVADDGSVRFAAPALAAVART